MPVKSEVRNDMNKDTLPVETTDLAKNGGTIVYANEVIATIAGVAANEVEGIAGMYSTGGISDILGKNRNLTRGVKVEIGTEEASVDLGVVIEYGTPIHKAAQNAQESVKKAIETMTGLHVVRVDVHVQGVSFEKETKALRLGAEKANLAAAETKHLEDIKENQETKNKKKKNTEKESAEVEILNQEQSVEQPSEAADEIGGETAKETSN